MGHHLCALIGSKPIDEGKAKHYQLAVAYEKDYAIILLDMDSVEYWSGKLNLSSEPVSQSIEWACELVFHFAKELGLDTYAIIQTDYFGGIGTQSALVFKDGQPTGAETRINEALRKLGVKRTDQEDEFDTLNLGEYRGSEYYYWDERNEADTMPNMIAGRIPKDG